MIDPNVLNYIRSEAGKGVSREDITKTLMQTGGWTLPDIQAHFAAIDRPSDPASAPFTPKPKKQRSFWGKVLYAIGRLLLILIVILVIGFGVCLLILSQY